MKALTLLLFSLLSLNLLAQEEQKEIRVEISGTIFNTDGDSIFISQFFGDHYEDITGVKIKQKGKKKGNFMFKFKKTVLPGADYYVLRFGTSHLNLILRDSAVIQVYGDGKNIDQFANIIGSDESMRMNEYLRIEREWKLLVDSANAAIKNDPSVQQEINRKMQREMTQYQNKVKSFIAQNKNSAALIAVLSGIDRNADFKSYEDVIKQLVAGFGESPTVKNLYKEYVAVRDQRLANDPLAPGKMAPDFTEIMPSGDSLSLSDLRGKVVLLDFWASWCGPCRRENPNVVQAYKKYKDDGFTVMSVSLDKEKSKWLAAIEKDALIWPNHVSDLKFWSSKAAKAYGVSSIPFTVLIDQEGKIIGTRIRGPQLEAELARIFGH